MQEALTTDTQSWSAVFRVPFEISFRNTDSFTFNLDYLDSFIAACSTFFQVHDENITVSYIQELRYIEYYIKLGFTVSANSYDEEERIQSADLYTFRSQLLLNQNLPIIIGIESKYHVCSNGQYSTFYHYDIECQWLCAESAIYNNQTNECESVTGTVYATETNLSRFLYIGYASSALITLFFSALYALNGYINRNKSRFSSLPNSTPSNKTEVSNGSKLPPLLKRKSTYFYNDTDHNDDEEEDKGQKMMDEIGAFPESNSDGKQDTDSTANADDEKPAELVATEKAENIALSINTTRSNSMEPTNSKATSGGIAAKAVKSVLQSPRTQNEEMFRESTLAPLEEMECDEKLKKRKSMIIEQARLEQFKLMDELDEFRKRLDTETEKEGTEKRQVLETKYLEQRESLKQEEKKQELKRLDSAYNKEMMLLEEQSEDKKRKRFQAFKEKVKERLLGIKSNAKQELTNLAHGEQSDEVMTTQSTTQ